MQEVLSSKVIDKNYSSYREFFYKKKEFIALSELLKLTEIINAETINPQDKIYNVETITRAKNGEATFLSGAFLSSGKYIEELKDTKAEFCIIDEKHKEILPKGTKAIVVKNPYYVYTLLLNLLYAVPNFILEPKISDKATISSTAEIGNGVEIQAGVVIEDGAKIGDNCKICSNAVIGRNCTIGNNSYIGSNTTILYSKIGQNVIIHNNTSIGQCGFGFVHEKGFNYKIPQLCIVEISDYVEIGSCVAIDRGAQNNTRIGRCTKIDNLVQIAHGVQVGDGCFFSAQVGIAGSVNIGNYVQLGGKAGIAGNIRIGDMAQVAANSGVMKNVENGSVVAGAPAMPIRDWHRTTILLKKLLKKEKYE